MNNNIENKYSRIIITCISCKNLTQVSLGGLPDHQRFDSTVIRFLILKNSERSAELIRLVGKWVSGMCVCGVFGEKKFVWFPPYHSRVVWGVGDCWV